MMPAQYFSSGEIPKDQWRHYGLAAPVYTHFTSPIRRYADIIVHRLLASTIGVIPLPVTLADRGKQQDLCSHMNRRHKAAQHVQRASVSMHTLLYFKDRPCIATAYVSSVKSNYFTVIVPRFGIEGTIEADSLKSKATLDYSYDPQLHTIIYTSDDLEVLRVQVFQQIVVRIRAVEGSGGTRKLEISVVKEATGEIDPPLADMADNSLIEDKLHNEDRDNAVPPSSTKKRARTPQSSSSPSTGRDRKRPQGIKALRRSHAR